jgi:1-phosphatidylinositol-3-phosphate 5-kinase
MDEPFDEAEISAPNSERDVSAPPAVPGKAERLHNGVPEGPVGILVTDQDHSNRAPQQADMNQDPAHVLSDLRHAFQRAEQAQYSQLAATPITTLNNVRWSFRSTARSATKRLAAWEKKHLQGKIDVKIFHEKIVSKEPQWWRHGCYAAPGGNVIVREGDWGSIIAYTIR